MEEEKYLRASNRNLISSEMRIVGLFEGYVLVDKKPKKDLRRQFYINDVVRWARAPRRNLN